MKKSAFLFFLSFLLVISCYLSLVTSAFAQAKTVQQVTPISSNTNPNVPNNLHNWTQNVMIEVMSSLTCQITGVDPINLRQSCLGIDQTTNKIGFLPSLKSGQGGGAIGFMGNMISMLYTPPLHTSDYFQNLAQNFGITKKTYAQQTGTGFDGLKPLLGLWTAFRNIVYLIFVLVFIIIGLAIMLRVKIDPRTVMTIQNQIPKIIIGILLVTFSYAIAGFLIDLMYELTYIATNIIAQADPKIADNIAQIAQSTNPFSAGNQSFSIGSTIGRSADSVGGFIGPLFDNFVGRLIIGTITGTAGKIVGSSLKDIITSIGVLIPGGGVLMPLVSAVSGSMFSNILGGLSFGLGFAFAPQIGGFVGGFIAYVVIAIALLIALFRLWLALIGCYIYILIDIILAPFWIIAGAVPGSPISFTGWLRDMAANLLAFPTTIAMFLMGKVILDTFGAAGKAGFIPPLIANPTDTKAIGAIIGLGFILITPNVLNTLKTALKAPKIDTGFGKAIGVGPALALNVGKNIGGTLTGAEEAIMRKQPGGGYNWGERGLPRAIFGRFLGR